jgi:hypothetical protein
MAQSHTKDRSGTSRIPVQHKITASHPPPRKFTLLSFPPRGFRDQPQTQVDMPDLEVSIEFPILRIRPCRKPSCSPRKRTKAADRPVHAA